jgi:hypothetical protein
MPGQPPAPLTIEDEDGYELCMLEGWDWIAALRESGWHAVPSWGPKGADLGEWPYRVVAHYDSPTGTVFGLATYTEGDVYVTGYETQAERNAATDEYDN